MVSSDGAEDEDDGFLANKACEICGQPAKRVNFARLLCDKEECINTAFSERGGPGGHKLAKK